MKTLFSKILSRRANKKVITIVSGLPRSGTSMMMRMLEAGGMPIATDNIRKADEDNPRGYFEFEKAKKIEEDSSWLEDCHGKAFKMVSALLYHLPKKNHYKVIFMKREMEELLASQRVMLERRGEKGAGLSEEEMEVRFQEHLGRLQTWLAKQMHIDVLYVNYNDVIKNSRGNAILVSAFLGDGLDAEKMASVVEKSLYRQRKRTEDGGQRTEDGSACGGTKINWLTKEPQ